ncbi:uridine 5'-monophosphate synthase [Cephus cinctus]|uniref:Uridine 5'-monophosphate synthase n=1 Tax=Cephus cinctus TaxID=211228 RepID=A0AAJ7BXC6_CEPCN|nr:uridine 5'-monophosphate synthase [Cephus cinctus]
MDGELKKLAEALFDIEALKFGNFVTKVGLPTPVYFDLRVIISHPKIMQKLSKILWSLSNESSEFNQICGVPYTALPIATIISMESNIPMLIRRKEAKSYGTKKLIEGKFKSGENCVIIEDVVTSGSSILETANDLRTEGLKVTQAFVIIDREQGGRSLLKSNGIKMKSLFTLMQLMQLLFELGKVSSEAVQNVSEYIKNCHSPIKELQENCQDRLKMNFSSRAKATNNPVASRLFQLMDAKKSTLCLAVDLTKTDCIIELAELLGPHIVILKIHIDIVQDFSEEFIKRLRDSAEKHNFLIMEDRKFGDIGHTVSLQYRKGVYKIAEWADIVTAHPVAGPGTVSGLVEGLDGISEPRGIFLVTEMSSRGALTTSNYVKSSISIAKSSNLIIGLVCQSNAFNDPALIQLTPGVKLVEKSDDLGQQYNSPEFVVQTGADIAVVGRGITESSNKLLTALQYKEKLWMAYQKRISD